jgi:hypothetical protein
MAVSYNAIIMVLGFGWYLFSTMPRPPALASVNQTLREISYKSLTCKPTYAFGDSVVDKITS